jgi:ABC-type glycerol-3-phosphate transport system permease component
MSTLRARRTTHNLLVYVSAVILCAFSLLPLLWALSTSLKRESQVYTSVVQWIPHPFTLESYQSVFANTAMIGYFRNSLIIAAGTTIIALIVGVLGGYGFSRPRFPGRTALLWSVLFTQLLPRVAVTVPFYVTLRNIHLLNTYPGLILVYLMVVFPVSVWVLKGFFDNLPREIEEAAMMDGCSVPQLLVRIVLPLSGPAIAAVAMYAFILAWNEFLFGLIFTNGPSHQPLSVALALFITDNGIQWGQLMAASLLMSVPSIVVFMLAQRLLVRGLTQGALKE